ncbi:Z1 domain-containing protein [Helicobacter labacensis]|uniref:Z1 domain-containing protein n=1 Tax=Helicobacter labacensis TaxID=2316079 RepID=UPI000EB112FA|nr:Z1 domain-containing protein [Helicobacter labacensis]
MDSFCERILDMAKGNLQNKKIKKRENGEDLKKEDIDQEIKYIEDHFDAYRISLHSDRDSLGDNCKAQLRLDLEEFFGVGIQEPSLGIQEEEQRERDTSWYSKNLETNPDRFFWDKQKKFLETDKEESVPLDVIGGIDEDTDWIMNRLGDPKQKEIFKIYGLVVGHVQSGKTKNYISLIGKAVDAGYKFIIVIGGHTDLLRNQTQGRTDRMFVELQGNNKKVGRLTTEVKDFDENIADAVLKSIEANATILLVIKKNSQILEKIVDWITQQKDKKFDEYAMLLIDDESDWGSSNTNKTDDKRTAINGWIREVLSFFKKSSYVAYTATPFANIFINHRIDGDLFPRNFIYKLKTPSNYCGAQEIFIDNPEQYLVEIDDYKSAFPSKKSKTHQILELPKSLLEAVHVFFINIAIRYLRGQEKPNSMLVNVGIPIERHMRMTDLIGNYIDPLKKAVLGYAKLPNPEEQSPLIAKMQQIFQNKIKQDGWHVEFSWPQILEKLSTIIKDEDIVVREIHGEARQHFKLCNYEETKNVIAVGGLSLGRGFTLEGLSVSYLIRKSQHYDTLMQMGRWFGYRRGYQDLCKIYMPRGAQEDFTSITNNINEFMALLQKMNEEGKTPNDFGLAIKADSKRKLRPTAPNKSRHARARRQKEEELFETSRFSTNKSVHEKNFDYLVDFVKSLEGYRCKNPKELEYNNVGKNTLYLDVDKNEVLAFIKKFITDEQDVIRKGLEYLESSDEAWDVALCSGSDKEVEKLKEVGLQCRAVSRKHGKYVGDGHIAPSHRISQAYPYKVFVKRKYKKGIDNASSLRKELARPTLMLHVLNIKKDDKGEPYNNVPAYGLCFPNRGERDYSSILFENTVSQDQIDGKHGHGLEEDDDDE